MLACAEFRNMMRESKTDDWGRSVQRVDASACRAIMLRRGCGGLKHITVKSLWVQEAVREYSHTHDALIACPGKSNEREQQAKCLVLLRFTCPRGTQFGGLDEGRGRVGANSLAIALAVSLTLPASALMALCLLFRGGGVVCSSPSTLMRVSLPVCLETRCGATRRGAGDTQSCGDTGCRQNRNSGS